MVPGLAQDLLGLRGPDGGWRAAPDGAVTVEATVLAAAALEAAGLAPDPLQEEVTLWLRGLQRADGSFPVGPAIPTPSWSASLAGLYLRTRPDGRTAAARAAGWLLDHPGTRPGFIRRLKERVLALDFVEVDSGIPGWSWRPDTFPWVEPTAWTCLLLRKFDDEGGEGGDRIGASRFAEVKSLFADRESVGGGWNYGNRAVFDTPLPPNPDTTAVVLMAAQGWTEPWVDRGFAALDVMMEGTTSPLAHSLNRLARRLHGRPLEGEDAVTYQAKNTLIAQTRNFAMAILAEHPHPMFELAGPSEKRAGP